MLASWISEVVAWSSWVSAVAESDRAPLSPVAPICAKMRMMMGMTRNFSLPAGGLPAWAVFDDGDAVAMTPPNLVMDSKVV